jgi:hypothetical protein
MNVYKVYSGMRGHCMCGCTGKYSYTQRGAIEHSPGYEPNINERSVKIIAGKIARSANKVTDGDHVYVEQNGRVLVAWFD